MVEIITLGNWDIRVDNKSILEPISTHYRLMELLQYMLTFEGDKLIVERIYEDVFIDKDYYDPRRTLRTQISRLRYIFREDSFYKINYSLGGYTLELKENVIFDLKEFKDAIDTGLKLKNENTSGAIIYLKKGLDMYSGDYLRDIYYAEWMTVKRNELKRLFLEGLYSYVELLDKMERYNEIINTIEKALMYDKYDERLHTCYIRVLCQLGYKEQAMIHYNRYVYLLQKDLQLAPSESFIGNVEEIIKETDVNELSLREMEVEIEPELTKEEEIPKEKKIRNIPYMKINNYKVVIFTLHYKGSKMLTNLYDKPMKYLKEILESNLRKEDIYIEYTNNKMMVLLPDMSEESLKRISERIKDRFQASEKTEELLITAKYNFFRESRKI